MPSDQKKGHEGKLDDAWSGARVLGSFIVGLVSILGWLNVTPDLVGDALYSALRVLFPFLTMAAGGICGWCLASNRYKRKMSAEAKARTSQLDSTLSKFSRCQLDLMVRMADAMESKGSLGISMYSDDTATAAQLERTGVATWDSGGSGHRNWRLMPKWFELVRENRHAIESRAKGTVRH